MNHLCRLELAVIAAVASYPHMMAEEVGDPVGTAHARSRGNHSIQQ